MTVVNTQKIVVLFQLKIYRDAMNNNLSTIFRKYSIPALFFILGIMIIVVGVVKEQDTMFMAASILMFGAALISLLYSSGKLTTRLTYIIGITSGLAAIFTLYLSVMSVKSTTTYMQNYELCRGLAIQNLQDIRLIQKKHREKYGKYIDNWDDFVDFAKNGKIDEPIAKGTVPSGRITPEERDFLYNDKRPIDKDMTVQEAYLLSKWKEGPRYDSLFSDFVRDTIEVPVIQALFSSDSYKRSRDVAGYPKFSADSLPYIPFTGAREKWTLKVKDSVQMGDAFVPAIRVEGTIPFAKMQGKKNETLSFGQLTSNDDRGSWEE